MKVLLKLALFLLAAVSVLHTANSLSGAQARSGIEISSDAETAARKFIAKTRRNRIDGYGNLHLIMIETIQTERPNKPRSLLKNKIEFFSRDDRYFRVDSTVLEMKALQKKPDALRTRFILRPEGFVILGVPTEKGSFALIDWGPVDEGIVLLFNQEWMQRAARTGRLPADLIVDELISSESSLPNLYNRMVSDSDIRSTESLTASLQWTSRSQESLKEIKLLPDRTTLQVIWDSESASKSSWTSTSEMTCLPEKGVVKSYECDLTNSEFGQMTQRISYEYDFDQFGVIPSKCEQYIANTHEADDTYTTAVTWETEEVDLSPVPLGVFSFEAQGLNLEPQSVWSRRLSMLLVALALFGVVFLVKWYQRRDVT